MSSTWHTTLKEAVSSPPTSQATHISTRLKQATNIMEFVPLAHPSVVTAELSDRNGVYYVLKQPEHKTYLRLSSEQYNLWKRMNGEFTVQGLIVEHYMESGAFAHNMVVRLVHLLHHEHMLTEQPIQVWARLRQAIAARTWTNRLMKPAGSLITQQFGIKGIDGLMGKLYRGIGWLFFTRPVQILFLIVSIAGLYATGRIIDDPNYQFIGAQWVSSLALIWLASLLPVFIHELGHALTVKHFGREVPEGGLMLYLGMPAAYVNTTDMWLEGRKGRLAATWNGPYTGLIIGGICSLFILFFPTHTASSFLFKMMGIAYLTVFMNINPLLKFDGYYLLSDALEIPNLRGRSMDFIRTRLINKLGRRESFNREERIFSIYGLLSLVWLIYALFLMGSFWQTRIRSGIQVMLGEGYSLVAKAFSGLVVAALFALSLLLIIQALRFVQALVSRYIRIGGLQRHSRLAIHLGLLALVSTLILGGTEFSGQRDWLALVSAIPLLVAAGFLLRFNKAYTGSARGAAHFAFAGGLSLATAWLVAKFLLANPKVVQEGLQVAFVLTMALGGLLVIHNPRGRVTPMSFLIGVILGFAVYFGSELLTVRLAAQVGMGLLAAVGWWSSSSVSGSARRPAIFLLFAGGVMFLAPASQFISVLRIDVFACGLLAAGAFHLVTARLPQLTRMEISELPSSTDQATSTAVAILVRRVIAQVFFESGWPGVGVFGNEFNRSMLSNGIQLEIHRNEWIDQEMGRRNTIQISETYSIALEKTYDLIQSTLGKELGRATFRLGLDLIPWEMREIIVEMFARRSSWGKSLNQSLANEKNLRLELLQRVPLFMSSSTEEREQLAANFATEHFNPGEHIVNQGEAGDKFYLLQHGTAEVWIEGEDGISLRVNLLGPGQFFGEAALISDKPRNATIVAHTPVQALSIKRRDFDELVRNRLDSSKSAHNQVRNQWILRSMPLFDELEAIDLDFLAALLKTEKFAPGEVVIREGDVGDRFYIVESGELVVTHNVNGITSELSNRRAGDYFGEIALLEKRPRTATVTTLTDTVLLSLSAEDFYDTIPSFMKMRETLEQSSSRRLNLIMRNQKAVEGFANPAPPEK